MSDGKRNYQIDFLKFILTGFVFLTHTESYMGENTRLTLPFGIGWISVHLFFIISGFLMVASVCRKEYDLATAGKTALSYVLDKFGRIAPQYWIALAVLMAVYLPMRVTQPLQLAMYLAKLFPELFAVTNFGIALEFNGPTWYLSAMFIVMIPLVYMLIKHKDFFLHVFAPLAALILLGYMYQTDFMDRNTMYGFIYGGLLRALCGLCFGVIAWLIYNYVYNNTTKKSQMVLLTVVEILLYLIFFSVWMFTRSDQSIFSVLLIIPIAIAISFSGKSYVSKLFSFRWMRFMAPVSLLIYLNHYTAKAVVTNVFPKMSYKMSVLIMAGLTVVFVLLSYGIERLWRFIWQKKLKSIFTNGK